MDDYNAEVLENALKEALPLKYLWSVEQRFGQYLIFEKTKENSFYSRQDGLFAKNIVLKRMKISF